MELLLLQNPMAIGLDLLSAACSDFVSSCYGILSEIPSLLFMGITNPVQIWILSEQSLNHLHPSFSGKILEIVESLQLQEKW